MIAHGLHSDSSLRQHVVGATSPLIDSILLTTNTQYLAYLRVTDLHVRRVWDPGIEVVDSSEGTSKPTTVNAASNASNDHTIQANSTTRRDNPWCAPRRSYFSLTREADIAFVHRVLTRDADSRVYSHRVQDAYSRVYSPCINWFYSCSASCAWNYTRQRHPSIHSSCALSYSRRVGIRVRQYKIFKQLVQLPSAVNPTAKLSKKHTVQSKPSIALLTSYQAIESLNTVN